MDAKKVDVLDKLAGAAQWLRANGNEAGACEIEKIADVVGVLIYGASSAYMALIGYLPDHRNAVIDGAIVDVHTALARAGIVA